MSTMTRRYIEPSEADRLAALACGEPDGKPCTVPDCPWCHANPTGWAVESGRCLTFEGTPLFTVNGLSDAAGYRYHPAELDALTHDIAAALNTSKVDGSRVGRSR